MAIAGPELLYDFGIVFQVSALILGILLIILGIALLIYGMFKLARKEREFLGFSKETKTRRWGNNSVEIYAPVSEIRAFPWLIQGKNHNVKEPFYAIGSYITTTGAVYPYLLKVEALINDQLPMQVHIFYDIENPAIHRVEWENLRNEVFSETVLPDENGVLTPFPTMDVGNVEAAPQLLWGKPGADFFYPGMVVPAYGVVVPPVESPVYEAWNKNRIKTNNKMTRKTIFAGIFLFLVGIFLIRMTNGESSPSIRFGLLVLGVLLMALGLAASIKMIYLCKKANETQSVVDPMRKNLSK